MKPGGPLTALAVLALAAAALAAVAPAEEARLLLALKTSVDNGAAGAWDAALASPGCQASAGADWAAGTLPCGDGAGAAAWRGVQCDATGSVTHLSLPFCGLTAGLPASVAKLQKLQVLDLSHNAFTGGVPPEWTAAGAFPQLDTLQLAFNNLTGGLADFDMTVGGFIAASYFNVSTNGFSATPLPATWYSRTLLLLDVAYNGVSGPLPEQWGEPKAGHEAAYPSAFPSLERLALEGNNLSGPADPWPRGSANIFGANFYCTVSPGNVYLEAMPVAGGSPDAAGGASSSGGGLSAGAIAGIAVGAVAGLALVAGLVLFVVKRRRAAVPAAPPAPLAAKPSSSAASDLEGGGKGRLRDGAEDGGVAMGSAFDGRKVAGPAAGLDHHSDLSSGALLSGSAISRLSNESGRTFGSMLADTDAKRLPSEWNTVLFSELEMECSVGAGSFGSVWRAKYCSTSVAVKMLGVDKQPSASDTSHQRKITRQLEKEAGIMSKLRHTNICLYMGACLEPPCLLMEYCARRSVDALLAQGLRDRKAAKQLSWPRLLSMASDAAKGMVYLHSRQPAVYHRDLKSANLLVTSQWQVKVADFNLSRALEPTDFMSSLCIQNPRWLAPEVLAGDEGGLAADVWAFGTVLWELMTWRAPFEGSNPYQARIINTVQASSHGSGLVIPAADELPAGPLGEYPALVQLVEACWERDPRRRPTFEEVAARLRTILQAEMRRNNDASASPLGSAQAGSGQPSPHATIQTIHSAATSALPSVVEPAADGPQATLASNAGSHTSFEAATRATSNAFQEALRDSFGSQQGAAAAAAAVQQQQQQP